MDAARPSLNLDLFDAQTLRPFVRRVARRAPGKTRIERFWAVIQRKPNGLETYLGIFPDLEQAKSLARGLWNH